MMRAAPSQSGKATVLVVLLFLLPLLLLLFWHGCDEVGPSDLLPQAPHPAQPLSVQGWRDLSLQLKAYAERAPTQQGVLEASQAALLLAEVGRLGQLLIEEWQPAQLARLLELEHQAGDLRSRLQELSSDGDLPDEQRARLAAYHAWLRSLAEDLSAFYSLIRLEIQGNPPSPADLDRYQSLLRVQAEAERGLLAPPRSDRLPSNSLRQYFHGSASWPLMREVLQPRQHLSTLLEGDPALSWPQIYERIQRSRLAEMEQSPLRQALVDRLALLRPAFRPHAGDILSTLAADQQALNKIYDSLQTVAELQSWQPLGQALDEGLRLFNAPGPANLGERLLDNPQALERDLRQLLRTLPYDWQATQARINPQQMLIEPALQLVALLELGDFSDSEPLIQEISRHAPEALRIFDTWRAYEHQRQELRLSLADQLRRARDWRQDLSGLAVTLGSQRRKARLLDELLEKLPGTAAMVEGLRSRHQQEFAVLLDPPALNPLPLPDHLSDAALLSLHYWMYAWEVGLSETDLRPLAELSEALAGRGLADEQAVAERLLRLLGLRRKLALALLSIEDGSRDWQVLAQAVAASAAEPLWQKHSQGRQRALDAWLEVSGAASPLPLLALHPQAESLAAATQSDPLTTVDAEVLDYARQLLQRQRRPLPGAPDQGDYPMAQALAQALVLQERWAQIALPQLDGLRRILDQDIKGATELSLALARRGNDQRATWRQLQAQIRAWQPRMPLMQDLRWAELLRSSYFDTRPWQVQIDQGTRVALDVERAGNWVAGRAVRLAGFDVPASQANDYWSCQERDGQRWIIAERDQHFLLPLAQEEPPLIQFHTYHYSYAGFAGWRWHQLLREVLLDDVAALRQMIANRNLDELGLPLPFAAMEAELTPQAADPLSSEDIEGLLHDWGLGDDR